MVDYYTKAETKQFGLPTLVSSKTEPPGSIVFSTVAAAPQSVVCTVDKGFNDPNWKEKLKKGDGVVTHMLGSNLKCEGNDLFAGKHVIKNVNSGVTVTRQFWGDAAGLCDLPAAPSDIASTRADNKAKMVFVKKALAAQQGLQGLVALGELHQTINLLKHPLSSLRNAFDRLQDVAWKRRRAFGKTYKGKHEKTAVRKLMADTYLEWAFGAQPLVADIESAAQAVARTLTYNPPQVFISARGHSDEASSLQGGARQGGNGLRVEYVRQTTKSAEVHYYGSVWTVVPGLQTYGGQFGVRLMDVVPAVWELIPYSFFVDYFTNAQEIVNAACFPTSTLRWVARGELVDTAVELVSVKFNPQIGLLFGDVIQENSLSLGTGCKVHRTIIKRDVYEGGWIPSLEFQIPNSPKKWLNVAALAAAGKRFNGTNRL